MLEKEIKEWRRQLAANGLNDENILEELEGHLRQSVARQTESGMDAQQAFDSAVEDIGQADMLRSEFSKVSIPDWRRRLAFVAWAMFAVSFFLASFENGPGWACAIQQVYFWPGVIQGRWGSIHYELLTLANLLMLASPWLVLKFNGNRRAVKWFHISTVFASILVWSFIGLLLANDTRSELKIGCFVWGASFLVLHLSTYSFSFRNKACATA